MPAVHALVDCVLRESFRARQVAGMFDLPVGAGAQSSFSVEVPSLEEPWSVGVIVGPSGSGKTTIARKAFGDWMVEDWGWSEDQSILESFPARMGVREITQLLGSVGFSSPPAWLRPFRLLSNGERFRVSMARTLAETSTGSVQGMPDLAVVDEFTSVVDRMVARIGSSAISRAVRRMNRRFVAVTCHYDVLPWLEPDWVLDMADGSLSRGLVRRPPIDLEIVRCDSSAWKLFSRHHYLNGQIHSGAQCYVGLVEGQAAAFVAAIFFPHADRPGWREHRCVCLPDFQGVGIGNAISEFVASLYASTGKPYRSVTSHPAMIHHRARSSAWRLTRAPSRVQPNYRSGRRTDVCSKTLSSGRMTASFEYVGETRREIAAGFGIKVQPAEGDLQGKHERSRTSTCGASDKGRPEPQLESEVV